MWQALDLKSAFRRTPCPERVCSGSRHIHNTPRVVVEAFALQGLSGRPSPHSGDQRCELLVEADMIRAWVEQIDVLDWLDPAFGDAGHFGVRQCSPE